MRLLVILPRVPYPLEKGDKLRAYHHLKYLSKFHEIHLCCLNDLPLHPEAEINLRPFCKSISIIQLGKTGIYFNILKAFLSGRPLQAGYFYSCRMARKIAEIMETVKPEHVFCQLIRTARYAEKLSVAKTLDFQDVFSVGAGRMKDSMPFYIRPFLGLESKRVAAYEAKMFSIFDNLVIISEPDRDAICHPDKERIVVVSNGVDGDYFIPAEREKKFDLLFTGNMSYPPNVNGVEYLVRQILPLVHASRPETRLMIAGANPSPAVLALASDKVEVSGWVEDIRECYAASRVFIAPMQIGTGLQNKLLEAMAMQLPCITSPLANKALNAIDGVDILVGTTPAEYARHIIALLDDPEKEKEIALNGQRFVLSNYNWDAQTSKLERLISSTKQN